MVVARHALRNALIPIISLMGLDFGYILGGSVVIEHVFARPGIGGHDPAQHLLARFPGLAGLYVRVDGWHHHRQYSSGRRLRGGRSAHPALAGFQGGVTYGSIREQPVC